MDRSLRTLLYVDFAGALATVLVLILAAAPLAPQVGIGAAVLRSAGVVLVPFVLLVLSSARGNEAFFVRPRRRFIIAFNSAWFVASLLLLALGTLTVVGKWIVAAQAAVIVPLVGYELAALRRLS